MIKELTWDSAFFAKKIGALKAPFDELSALKDALKKARKDGLEYLTCRLSAQDTVMIKLLESNGFYLTDIGVTLTMNADTFSAKKLCCAATRKSADIIPPNPPFRKGGKGGFDGNE